MIQPRPYYGVGGVEGHVSDDFLSLKCRRATKDGVNGASREVDLDGIEVLAGVKLACGVRKGVV